ncbi:auxin efflux carrier [Choiromyces venosus 120613-1]|uniref:Auxin efflux carrier n=1 Tax=Choiromyces venosus 120613-1 TaxID=1336337 RepID=A0A3N4K6L2_9PEZI|nr:auxin efflux carrier [Choiromyces venosus 120613-1]
MAFLTSPTSFRNNEFLSSQQQPPHYLVAYSASFSNGSIPLDLSTMGKGQAPHSSHPALGHLILLVFEAVLEVVCVAFPGYIIARCGMFDVEMQKFVANLNVSLFTPCLIFTKLASQLTLSKIAELAVIPVIFVCMTLISYCCAVAVSKLCGFKKRARNFVIAMGVFGNSNSLPISLVISLSMTISGLHWDKIPGDNDGEVAARGILYLLIFQQLGQLVRWSWGYHVLLAPPPKDQPNGNDQAARYRDDPSDEGDGDIETQGPWVDPFMSPQFENSYVGLHKQASKNDALVAFDENRHRVRITNGAGGSGSLTPGSAYASTAVSTQSTRSSSPSSSATVVPPLQGNSGTRDFARFPDATRPDSPVTAPRWLLAGGSSIFARVYRDIKTGIIRFFKGLWSFMNPPLWAMFIAVIIASIPQLQKTFFTPGTFIQNSVTRAVSQTGNVAVPLILVVLGANLAGNTQPKANTSNERHETKILIAALISRMVLPFIFVAPLLAVAAKYLNVSILDDPIFVIVCFLLAGAPSALQLAQICQLNGVYESVMAKILFWSYVVVILPSTLVQVISAIEVVEWAM